MLKAIIILVNIIMDLNMNINLNKIQKRFALFLGMCIPIRLALTYITKVMPVKFLPLLGIPYLLFGLGIIYIYMTNSRIRGAETMGDKIWWNALRPVHGLLFLVFAMSAFFRNPDSWILLLIDTIIGFVAFWTYHVSVGNIAKLW